MNHHPQQLMTRVMIAAHRHNRRAHLQHHRSKANACHQNIACAMLSEVEVGGAADRCAGSLTCAASPDLVALHSIPVPSTEV